MTVAFIVRENIDVTDALKKRLQEVITKLVIDEWTNVFIFTDVGEFDRVCYDIVSNLKKIFPDIQRHHIRGDSDCNDFTRDRISNSYEKYFIPSEDDTVSYDLRDFAMISRCDILVTYCDLNFQMKAKWINSTATAIVTAWKKKKRVINLFESK